MDYYEWTLILSAVLAAATLLMAISIYATVFFVVKQLRQIEHARCSSILMQLHQTWDSKEYIRSRRMVNEYSNGDTPAESSQNLKESLISFRDVNAEEYYVMLRIANFFENLGFLALNQYLKGGDSQIFLDAAKNYWDKFSAFINYVEEENDDPQPDAWEYFKKLVSD